MIVGKIAKSNNDEYFTPRNAIFPILKYVKAGSKIWCPFDTEESEFVKVFEENGIKVIRSHISDKNGDFFELANNIESNINYIISNPPYSKKYEVLKKLFEINIPFAMLVGVVGLFDSGKKAELFSKNDFEIMYLNPRVKFKRGKEFNGAPPYQSVYICHNMLPQKIVFEKLINDK